MAIHILIVSISQVQGHSRTDMYNLLRDHLEEDVQKFWDEPTQQESIRDGVIHCGRYEQYFLNFARLIRPLVHRDRTTQKMLTLKEPQEQREFYDNIWDTWLWRSMVRLYMGDVLIGRCPLFYHRSDMNIGNVSLEFAFYSQS